MLKPVKFKRKKPPAFWLRCRTSLASDPEVWLLAVLAAATLALLLRALSPAI